MFTLSTVDPDDVSGFTYTFNGAGTAAVTVDGDSETFTLNPVTGAVTTTALAYNDPAVVTVTTYRTADDDGNLLTQTMTLRLGENGSNDTLNGSATTNDQVIYGFAGNDTVTGGSGKDWISGGDGNDTIVADQNDLVIDGAAGTDTLQVAANFNDASNAQINGIENILLTAGVTLVLDQQTEGFTITGSGSGNSITGGSGNDTIVGAQADTLLDGGGGTNTLNVGANFTSTGDVQIQNIQNVLLTAAVTLNLANQTEAFTITGSSGADTITGGSAADSINAGDGNDTINGAQNDTLLNGGNNTDTLNVAGGFTSSSDAQIQNIENVVLTSAGILNLANQTEGFTITGSAGIDSITGGGGNDTIVGAVNDALLAGGRGIDTLNVGANFTSTGDGQIVGIETVTLTASNLTLNLSNQTEGFTINGSSGVDTITAGSGNDVVNSNGGSDTINTGAGADTVNVTGAATATSWTVDFGSDADIDKIVFTNSAFGNGHNTVATISNFNVANDRVAVLLGATNIADGTFQTIAADGTNVSCRHRSHRNSGQRR